MWGRANAGGLPYLRIAESAIARGSIHAIVLFAQLTAVGTHPDIRINAAPRAAEFVYSAAIIRSAHPLRIFGGMHYSSS